MRARRPRADRRALREQGPGGTRAAGTVTVTFGEPVTFPSARTGALARELERRVAALERPVDRRAAGRRVPAKATRPVGGFPTTYLATSRRSTGARVLLGWIDRAGVELRRASYSLERLRLAR